MKHKTPAPDLRNKKDVIVQTAFEAFYNKGFHAAGVDHLLTGTGISKRTLYSYFASKEDLIAATVEFYHQRALASISQFVEQNSARPPEEKILRLFDWLDMVVKSGEARGCYAMNAKLEYSSRHEAIENACETYMSVVEEMIRGLCVQAGKKNSKALARQLLMLFQGAIVIGLAQFSDSPKLAKAAAKSLLAGSSF